MLIIDRKVGESIYVGEDVEIQVARLKGKHVRLGVEAPDGLVIHRDAAWAGGLRPTDSNKWLRILYQGLGRFQKRCSGEEYVDVSAVRDRVGRLLVNDPMAKDILAGDLL